MLKKLIWEPLTEALAARLIDHLDDIAAAIARAVMAELEPKLPDLSDLDEQIVAKLPDLASITDQIVARLLAAIPKWPNPFGGGR